VIDEDGYRQNVGIILTNNEGRVFLGKRVNQEAWQFPQGGIAKGETPEEAMYRELHEEIGLSKKDVKILAVTDNWLRYQLPEKYIRRGQKPLCLGQKQKWFLLSLVTDESHIDLSKTSIPEFDKWSWVFYWAPVKKVIHFKRRVYVKALKFLRPYLHS
jgi:putative (di)nucleoside polyphosphate hydrolase